MKTTKYFIFALIILFFSLQLKGQNSGNNLDQITIKSGLISGVKNKTGDVHIFKGIPFATPPVGNLRWKDPQPVATWKGVKKCNHFSASPMQSPPTPFGVYTEEFLIPKAPIGEDCLYLNVWTGAQNAGEKKPVLVWIYGGGFGSGGTACAIYDGEALAKKGIIFVSINYRVGIFGFYSHPELSQESEHHTSGNYGLLDQIAALKWVKENIAAFGGDPDQVTIDGQSAGAMSVNCLVASPLAKGLFKRAIAQSGASFMGGFRASASLKDSEIQGLKMAQSINASTLEDLRKIPAEELQKKMQGRQGPICDGFVLPDLISNIFAAGKQNHVDLLTGWNGDDGFIMGGIKNAADYKDQISQQYGVETADYLKYYPGNTDQEAEDSQKAFARDMFGVQNYIWANVQSNEGSTKVYVYNFNRKVPATPDFVKYGAFHTGEVVYAFNNLAFENRPWLDMDHQLASVMSSYWVNFIKTGNPSGANLPKWPAYSAQNPQVMIFDAKSEVKTLPSKENLDFLYEKLKMEK
jgi:para-nitrobenzyl esterase